MSKESVISALKGALLLEYRGKELYASVLTATKNEAVRELFTFLKEEEDRHIGLLKRQFTEVSHGKEIKLEPGLDSDDEAPKQVLNDKIVKGISGAGYEAAVISAAVELEKRAVDYYQSKVDQAVSSGEKELYNWLVKWEKGHMMMLAAIDNDLKEKVWYDNQFWPLD